MPPVVAAAGIAGAASIAGGIIGGKSAKGAAKSQADTAQQALAEQRRIYDLESAKEDEQRRYDRAQKELDRAKADREDAKSARDEAMVLGSRRNAFGGFGGDLAQFSKGYAPAYGMSAEQSQGVLDQRNSGFSGGGGYRAPSMGDGGVGQAMTTPANMAGPQGGAMGSTVWLQAPTGETMEVSLQDAPPMLQKGAILIPAPTGGR